MSKIHYFQRYSLPENTVTNNTLQLVARIYEHSAVKASEFLTDITGVESIEIGLAIVQQKRVGDAVPDGAIIQQSFKILIEAKVDTPVNHNQLLRHAKALEGVNQGILLLLTKHPIGLQEQEIASRIRAEHPNVIFKSITYETICDSLKGLFKPHEERMVALIEDYVEYCNDTKLNDQSKFLLRIVPCRNSVEINKKNGIYFHPSDRGYTPHAFVGIYAQKTVQAILKVESVFDVELTDDSLKKTLVDGAANDRFDGRLRQIIKDAKKDCGYEVASGYRFFCGAMVDTDYQKSSPGGIQGTKFINLRDKLGRFSGVKDVASKLLGKTWE
jgi:hypothetical protein